MDKSNNLKLLITICFLLVSISLKAQKLVELERIGSFQHASSFGRIASGSFYILDKGTSEIIKTDSAGNVQKRIGGIGWDEYTFDNPTDICVTQLKIYVTDKNNSRIQVYDADLNFLFSLDPKNFTLAKSIFKYPVSAAVSHFGDLYVADTDNKQILKFNANWEFAGAFGNFSYGKYAINSPVKLVTDNNSNLFVLDGKKLIIYDQYGNGISINGLAELPLNLQYSEGTIQILFHNYLYTALPGEDLHIPMEFRKYNFSFEEPVKEVFLKGGFFYLLTDNSIIKCKADAL